MIGLIQSKIFLRFAAGFDRRGRALVAALDLRIDAIIALWIGAMGLIATAKILPAIVTHRWSDLIEMVPPFLLVAVAPVAGYRVAQSCFPHGFVGALPSIRLCRYGRWHELDVVSATASHGYGPAGFMASLVVGILLNVPFRTGEFLLAVPAMGIDAPAWAHVIRQVMTLDVVVMNFFYMVCFVMALRSVPLFPRMLIFTWMIDVVMQLTIARAVSEAPGLPANVVPALESMLSGNMQKVVISACIWLPYLILSERVNVTFRRRVRA